MWNTYMKEYESNGRITPRYPNRINYDTQIFFTEVLFYEQNQVKLKL